MLSTNEIATRWMRGETSADDDIFIANVFEALDPPVTIAAILDQFPFIHEKDGVVSYGGIVQWDVQDSSPEHRLMAYRAAWSQIKLNQAINRRIAARLRKGV